MEEYKGGGFCKSINCLENHNRESGNKAFCKLKCKAYQFYQYLRDNGYKIIKEESK